jgi:hypothetical protein
LKVFDPSRGWVLLAVSAGAFQVGNFPNWSARRYCLVIDPTNLRYLPVAQVREIKKASRELLPLAVWGERN